MRRIMVGTGVLALVALGITFTGAHPARSEAGETMRFYEHDDSDVVVDVGDKGESAGDQYLYAGDLFDHKGGTKVGRVGGVCQTISTGKGGMSQCSAAFILGDGQILGEGVFDTAALFGGGQTLPFAITGGTGAYRDVQGTGMVQVPPDVPNYADANWELHLS